ncbi:HlyD family efflux transporter periplasmic adaptor subunit [Oribacterium sp. WCC10]|uniref:HlyD family efflux transporter periplasmic adaptor subunit n=1 Tax=Oribacterium sp. WCC10 TaxID=1855343 RepID=UPI0008E1B6E5|nr:HlyD family efflux transporter periplasmic adaptor subunit [Oribacterium sp. WCC10]SFG18506.1 RND family efflux transporter, MFP subunit [Oribacterium sp. WCC10]
MLNKMKSKPDDINLRDSISGSKNNIGNNLKKTGVKASKGFKVTGKVKVIAALCFMAVVSGGLFVRHSISARAAEQVNIMDDTIPVQRIDLSKSITLNGTIMSAESKSISSTVSDAEVKSVMVKVGDRVKKGDTIAILSTDNLEKQLELAKAQLNNTVEKNRNDIDEAGRNLENAKMTMSNQVAQATLDINTTTEKLHQSETDVLNAQQDIQKYLLEENQLQTEIDSCQDIYDSEQAVLRNKQRKLTRLQSGEDDGDDDHGDSSTTKLQLDIDQITNSQSDRQSHISELKTKLSEAQSKRKEAETKLQSAKDNIDSYNQTLQKSQMTLAETNTSNQKSIQDSESGIAMAKMNAEYSEKNAQNDVEKVQKQINEAVITAPIDGVVTNLNVSVGDIYKGDVIAVIQDTSGFKASAEADQYDISDIAADMKATVTTKTTGDTEMNGEVTFVSPIPGVTSTGKDSSTTNAKSSSSNYPIEVTLQDPSDRLRIGMSAKIKILEKEVKDVLAVPGTYIDTDEEGNSIVYVMEDDGSRKAVKVETGLKTDYYIEVKSDELKEGDNVVSSSTETEISVQ